MKYLILSDIHGALPTLERALNFYKARHCDLLCILGDILNYGPRNGLPPGLDPQGVADRLNSMADDIVAIRGNCDSEVDQMLLRFPMLSECMLIVDNGHRLLLTHGHLYNKEKLPPGRFDAMFYGHTHLWELSRQGQTVICNTGSITFPKGGKEPTMAVYEDGVISVHHLDGTLLQQERLMR